MRFGSVCSGIEAASVAWHPLGWRASFLSEIEAFPRAVLSHHYPEVPLHGDFTTIRAGEYEPIDLLVGGTPCQSFSVAGLRGGLDHDRGNLALEYLRLADRLRPRWLVWENVPGVLSSNGGRDFGAILGGMVELGYGFAYRVLDAHGFDLPGTRPRVLVVGYSGDWRAATAVLFDRSSFGALASARLPRKEAHGTLTTGSGTKRNFDGSCTLIEDEGGIRVTTPLEWERILGFPDGYTDLSQESPFARSSGAEPVDALRHQPGELRRDVGASGRCVRALLGADGEAGSGPLPLDEGGQGNPLPPLQHQAASGRGHGMGDAGMGVSGRPRLVADGPRYKALGNSMAVPVMRWIGQRIAQVDAIPHLQDERSAA